MAIASLASGIIAYKTIVDHTAYTVARVIDGDTFETSEKQRIRISGIQAPEVGMCGSKEATETLERYIKGKKVFIKVVYLDSYRRQIADVYLSDGRPLSYLLASSGRVYVHQVTATDPKLLSAGSDARTKKLGVYGAECTQTTNTSRPKCMIKANKPLSSSGKPTYHVPGCNSYSITQVQLYLGDRWFCTEAEAIKAGFTKAATCP